MSYIFRAAPFDFRNITGSFTPFTSPPNGQNLSNPPIMALNLAAVANATVATMRAVLWQGNAYNVTVADVPRPTIISQTDAGESRRITSSDNTS